MSQRILVIRPSRQADQFIALLEQAGAQILPYPSDDYRTPSRWSGD